MPTWRSEMRLTDYLNQLRTKAAKHGALVIAKQSGIDRNTVDNFLNEKNVTAKTMVGVEKAVTELEKNHG